MEKTLQSVTVEGMKFSLIQVWTDEPGSHLDLVGVEVSSGLRRLDIHGDTRYGRKPFVKGFCAVSPGLIKCFSPSRRKSVARLIGAISH
jgi:hypothetical protein